MTMVQTDTRWNVGENRCRSVGGRIANVGDLVIEGRIKLFDIDLKPRPLFTPTQRQINCVPQLTRFGAAGIHPLNPEFLTLSAT